MTVYITIYIIYILFIIYNLYITYIYIQTIDFELILDRRIIISS